MLSHDKRVDPIGTCVGVRGTRVNAVWVRELDKIAAALSELQNAGVTVLWRPLHEANGRTFWWSQTITDVQYRALWQSMFRYFTEEKKLNNLLWVWSVLPRKFNALLPEEVRYPGDAYVDLVGVDSYGADLFIPGYGELMQPGKPFALTEFGPFTETEADGNPALKGPHFDYAALIGQIREKYPETCLFQCWNRPWAMVSQKNAPGLLTDAWVVNRGEINFESFKPEPAQPGTVVNLLKHMKIKTTGAIQARHDAAKGSLSFEASHGYLEGRLDGAADAGKYPYLVLRYQGGSAALGLELKNTDGVRIVADPRIAAANPRIQITLPDKTQHSFYVIDLSPFFIPPAANRNIKTFIFINPDRRLELSAVGLMDAAMLETYGLAAPRLQRSETRTNDAERTFGTEIPQMPQEAQASDDTKPDQAAIWSYLLQDDKRTGEFYTGAYYGGLVREWWPAGSRILDEGTYAFVLPRLAAGVNPALQFEGTDIFDVTPGEIPGSAGIPFKIAPINNTGYPANSFDAVTLGFVFEYVPDPRTALLEILKVLKWGGVAAGMLGHPQSQANIQNGIMLSQLELAFQSGLFEKAKRAAEALGTPAGNDIITNELNPALQRYWEEVSRGRSGAAEVNFPQAFIQGLNAVFSDPDRAAENLKVTLNPALQTRSEKVSAVLNHYEFGMRQNQVRWKLVQESVRPLENHTAVKALFEGQGFENVDVRLLKHGDESPVAWTVTLRKPARREVVLGAGERPDQIVINHQTITIPPYRAMSLAADLNRVFADFSGAPVFAGLAHGDDDRQLRFFRGHDTLKIENSFDPQELGRGLEWALQILPDRYPVSFPEDEKNRAVDVGNLRLFTSQSHVNLADNINSQLLKWDVTSAQPVAATVMGARRTVLDSRLYFMRGGRFETAQLTDREAVLKLIENAFDGIASVRQLNSEQNLRSEARMSHSGQVREVDRTANANSRGWTNSGIARDIKFDLSWDIFREFGKYINERHVLELDVRHGHVDLFEIEQGGKLSFLQRLGLNKQHYHEILSLLESQEIQFLQVDGDLWGQWIQDPKLAAREFERLLDSAFTYAEDGSYHRLRPQIGAPWFVASSNVPDREGLVLVAQRIEPAAKIDLKAEDLRRHFSLWPLLKEAFPEISMRQPSEDRILMDLSGNAKVSAEIMVDGDRAASLHLDRHKAVLGNLPASEDYLAEFLRVLLQYLKEAGIREVSFIFQDDSTEFVMDRFAAYIAPRNPGLNIYRYRVRQVDADLRLPLSAINLAYPRSETRKAAHAPGDLGLAVGNLVPPVLSRKTYDGKLSENAEINLKQVLQELGKTKVYVDGAAVFGDDLEARRVVSELASLADAGAEVMVYNLAQADPADLFYQLIQSFPSGTFENRNESFSDLLRALPPGSENVNLVHYSGISAETKRAAESDLPQFKDRIAYVVGEAGSAAYGLLQIQKIKKQLEAVRSNLAVPTLEDLGILFQEGTHRIAAAQANWMRQILAANFEVAFARAA